MATKFLGRTIVERGRPKGNIFDRRYSHRQRRSATRSWLAGLDNEGYEPADRPGPTTQPVRKELTDKLGAVYRWLDSQTGRLWDDVYAEICQRYPWDTLAGLHIIRSHVLPEVLPSDPQLAEFVRYQVDANGIFQKRPRRVRLQGPAWARPKEQETAKAWLAGRRVGKVGSQYYWYELSYARQLCTCRHCRTSYTVYKKNADWWTGKHWLATSPGAHDYYRQMTRLTSNEVATFLAFHPELQKEIVATKPPANIA